MKTSLRILNKKSNIMGLSVEDLIAVASIHFTVQSIFAFTHLEVDLFVLIFSILVFAALSVIRVKNRRHIIRDFSKYLFYQFRGGVAYDSTSYRYSSNR
jgi:hypothetical protein